MCDAFFERPTDFKNCDKHDLDEYETGAMTLLHEFTRLRPAYFSVQTTWDPPFEDHAYGSADCASLTSSLDPFKYNEAISNPGNWMFVTLGAFWSDKCGKQIEPGAHDAGSYTGPGGCLPGPTNEWIISAGGLCSANGVASNAKTHGGPGGCLIPHTGGVDGVDVADCQQLPQGTTGVEMTLAVTNATQVCRAVSSTSQLLQSQNNTQLLLACCVVDTT